MDISKISYLLPIIACGYLGSACGENAPSGEVKFLTFGQQGQYLNKLSLLQKAHANELVIGYAFADNAGCASRYTDNQVQSDISKVLNVWLEPLRGWSGLLTGKGQIVSNYRYVKGDILVLDEAQKTDVWINKNQEGKVIAIRNTGSGNPFLWIVFACRDMRSYYQFQAANVANPSVAKIFMGDQNGRYSVATLTHELGHAFGLYDTYVGAHAITGDKLLSACGNNRIVGCQPLAVMNVHRWLLADDDARIGADDVAGIRYVYRDIYAGEQACPAEYTQEMSTGGCKPINPLVFAIMQGDLRNASALLEERFASEQSGGKLSDFINRQDGKGATFLHYAAMRAASHGGKSYTWLLEYGADQTITNNAGERPADLLLPQIALSLMNYDTSIAESLISLTLKSEKQ